MRAYASRESATKAPSAIPLRFTAGTTTDCAPASPRGEKPGLLPQVKPRLLHPPVQVEAGKAEAGDRAEQVAHLVVENLVRPVERDVGVVHDVARERELLSRRQ